MKHEIKFEIQLETMFACSCPKSILTNFKFMSKQTICKLIELNWRQVPSIRIHFGFDCPWIMKSRSL